MGGRCSLLVYSRLGNQADRRTNSIMDKPSHIIVAVIGDGESETGPTATAWHAHKVRIKGLAVLRLTRCSISTQLKVGL